MIQLTSHSTAKQSSGKSIKTGVKTRKIIDDAAPVASKKEYNFLNTRNKTLKG
jgi:hypothetical protein